MAAPFLPSVKQSGYKVLRVKGLQIVNPFANSNVHYRHAQFPQPVRRLRSGDIWDRREIIAWATATGRYPVEAQPQS